MTQTHLSCSTDNVDLALKDAETICTQRGVKLTPIRMQVLRLLLERQAPAKAYDLLEELKYGEGSAKPPTIYRALDFLLEQGLAHKIESLNAFVACGHRHHGHAAVFLICEKCENAQELHASSTLDGLEKDTRNVSFQMKSVVIEAVGICSKCQLIA